MSLVKTIERREIQEVLHFTTRSGVVGTLATGALKARRQLNEDQYLSYILHKNSQRRPEAAPDFDKEEDWLDFVNLSITAINKMYLRFSKGWGHNAGIEWYVLAFDPVILTHEDVYFATTNNSYEHCHRAKGKSGFDMLFADTIARKQSWRAFRGGRKKSLPTCQQAEVLYPSAVSIKHLKRIYVEEPEHADAVNGWLRDFLVEGVEVMHDADVFKGEPN